VTFLDALPSLKDKILLKYGRFHTSAGEYLRPLVSSDRETLENSVHGAHCVTSQMGEGLISDVWWVPPCSREHCFIRFSGFSLLSFFEIVLK